MALPTGHRQNFDTLCQAVQAGDAALMECQHAITGEPVAVICAVNHSADGSYEFVPLALMFSDNPYTTVNPPDADRGFHSQQAEIENAKENASD